MGAGGGGGEEGEASKEPPIPACSSDTRYPDFAIFVQMTD